MTYKKSTGDFILPVFWLIYFLFFTNEKKNEGNKGPKLNKAEWLKEGLDKITADSKTWPV